MSLNFISSALAQEATNNNASSVANSSNPLLNFLPIVLIFIVFYFLIIRPQTKKMQEHQNMLTTLKVGNKVVTTSGIIGKITNINDKEISLKIAEEVEITILKDHISQLYTVGENSKTHKKHK